MLHIVGDLTFRVRSWSEGSGPAAPAFLLIHGIGTSHRYLRKLADALAGDVRIYTIDLPGFGGVPKPGVAPSVEKTASALGIIADRLSLGRTVLVGHSMGAQWVVETAVQRPDLVRAVVVIGPVTDDHHRSVVAQLRALTIDILGEPPASNAIVLVDYLRCGPSWFLRHLRYMISYPIEDRVPLLAAPLLVIRGGNDPIAGVEWCRRLRDRARAGRLISVPGHRHNAQDTAPRAVASAIRAAVGHP